MFGRNFIHSDACESVLIEMIEHLNFRCSDIKTMRKKLNGSIDVKPYLRYPVKDLSGKHPSKLFKNPS